MMNDSFTLFQMSMSTKGLAMSASVGSITYLPGESITDQIAAYHAPPPSPPGENKTTKAVAGAVVGVAAALVLGAAAVVLVCLRRRVRAGHPSMQKVWLSFHTCLCLCTLGSAAGGCRFRVVNAVVKFS